MDVIFTNIFVNLWSVLLKEKTQSTRRKPLSLCKSLINLFYTCNQ